MSSPPLFSDSTDADLVRYRSVSVSAGVALLLGLASVAALWGPMFWIVPLLGVAVGLFALWRVRAADPRPLGGSLAMVGLALSLMFLSASVSHYSFRQHRIRQQARAVGEQWLDFLANGQLDHAFEAMQPPASRAALDERLAEVYAADPQRAEQRAQFFDDPRNPAVRAIPILAQRGAQVRYYDTAGVVSTGDGDLIEDLYAVTYDDQGRRTSFFVKLRLLRRDDPLSARGLWRVVSCEGGVRP